jgi:hypothetical protein
MSKTKLSLLIVFISFCNNQIIDKITNITIIIFYFFIQINMHYIRIYKLINELDGSIDIVTFTIFSQY